MHYLFVISDSRSGSTLLSKMLSDYSEDVLVLPEIRIDRLSKIFENSKNATMFQKELKHVCIERQDLKNLELPGLQGIVNRCEFNTNLEDFIENIVHSYIEKNSLSKPTVLVIKKGNHHNSIQSFQKQLAKTCFVLLIRDPRAVYVSKIGSMMPRFPNQAMGWKGPLLCAFQWRKIEKKVLSQIENSKYFISVKYENLVSGADTVEEIFSRLNIEANTNGSSSNRNSFSPPEDQTHLHGNIVKSPSSEIAQAWKDKIKKRDALVLETILAKRLNFYKYPLLHSTSTAYDRATAISFEVFRLPKRLINQFINRVRKSK